MAPHRWARVRSTCSRTRYNGYVCTSRGHLHLEPVEPMSPDEPFVSMECGGCAVPWFAERVQFGRPPWTLAPIDPAKEHYRCPAAVGGCGRHSMARLSIRPDSQASAAPTGQLGSLGGLECRAAFPAGQDDACCAHATPSRPGVLHPPCRSRDSTRHTSGAITGWSPDSRGG